MASILEVKPNSPDIHSLSPFWLAAIIRFRHRRTSSPDIIASKGIDDLNVSNNQALSNPVAETAMTLLGPEIVQWSVNNSKSNHTSTASFVIVSPKYDVARNIQVGDWVFFWAVNSESKYNELRNRLLQQDATDLACNHYDDGLKFIGRCQSPRKSVTIQPSGHKSTVYSMAAIGFKELDSTIYYNDIMASRYANAAFQWMIDFAGDVNNFLLKGTKGTIQTQEAIPTLLDICLGVGPNTSTSIDPANFVGPLLENKQLTDKFQSTPNRQYLIPDSVLQILDGTPDNDPLKNAGTSYADILRTYTGVQYFSATPSHNRFRALNPIQSADVSRPNLRYTSEYKLLGDFTPLPMQFNGQSVWSILSTYLNDPINEMYTKLHPNALTGRIYPTLVIRQTPFTSTTLANAKPDTKFTRFVDLPRWRIDPSFIRSIDVGSTDQARVNYVHITTTDAKILDQQQNLQAQYVNNPPMIDQADVFRSGLALYHKNLGSQSNEALAVAEASPSRIYTRIMGDILFEAHLRWNGTLRCVGIQEPISHGDNIEVDGVLYHIEAIQHSGGVDTRTGMKSFNTTIALTHGISLKSDDADRNIYPYQDTDTRDYTITSDMPSTQETGFAQLPPVEDLLEKAVEFTSMNAIGGLGGILNGVS